MDPAPRAALHSIALRRLTLENNLVLAPMAGVSNLAFRLISREAGAALTFSETVSASRSAFAGLMSFPWAAARWQGFHTRWTVSSLPKSWASGR